MNNSGVAPSSTLRCPRLPFRTKDNPMLIYHLVPLVPRVIPPLVVPLVPRTIPPVPLDGGMIMFESGAHNLAVLGPAAAALGPAAAVLGAFACAAVRAA